MVKIPAELSSVSREVEMPAHTPRKQVKHDLRRGIESVLGAAIMSNGSTDLRRGILTAVCNYDTEAFEIRWDLAK